MIRKRKTATVSIHDVDTPEGRAARRTSTARRRVGRRAVAGLTVAGLAAAAGGGYALLRADSADRRAEPATSLLNDPATAAQPSSPGAASAVRSHVDIVLDGWSYRTLQGAPLSATVGSTSSTLQFRPAARADIAALLQGTPDLVRQTMARLVTDDPTLACTTTGCSASAGPLSPNLLLEPSTIPNLGLSYAGYDIRAGLYVARVDTSAGNGALVLSAPGHAPLRLTTHIEAAGATLKPSSTNGYLKGRYLVAAGLGQLFQPRAAWLGTGSDPKRYDTDAAAGIAEGAAADLEAASPALVATGGLSASLPAAAAWSPSHLTYATSPSTGCGPEALCAPALVKATVNRDVRSTASVCSPDGKSRGVAALQDVAVTVAFPAPTHQHGLGNKARWGKAPTLVSGTQPVRFGVLGLFDGDPLRERVAGGTVDPGGPPAITLGTALDAVRFDGSHWRAC